MNTYNGDKQLVFVSYCRRDSDVVYPIIETLQKKYRVWFDKGISLGHEWAAMITERLEHTAVFIFMLTKKSLESTNCKDELAYARDMGITFINLILEDVEFPKEFKLRYGRFQMCNAKDYNNYDELLKDLGNRCVEIADAKYDEYDLSGESEPVTSKINYRKNDLLDDINNYAATKRQQMLNSFLQNKLNIYDACKAYAVGPKITTFYFNFREWGRKMVEDNIQEIEKLIKVKKIRFDSCSNNDNPDIIEIENPEKQEVFLTDYLSSLPSSDTSPLSFILGVNTNNTVIKLNFNELPHMTVGGDDYNERKNFILAILATFITRNDPSNLQIVIFCNKRRNLYMHVSTLVHLRLPIMNDIEDVNDGLDTLIKEMNNRYELFKNEGVSSISEYNIKMQELGKNKLPRLFIVFDDASEHYISRDKITRLLQHSRDAGFSMLISDAVSLNTFSDETLSEAPTHVTFKVNKKIDSFATIRAKGADLLQGDGDMLVSSTKVDRNSIVRLQAPIITDQDLDRIARELEKKYGLYMKHPSISMLKRGIEMPISKNFIFDIGDEYLAVKEWVMTKEFVTSFDIKKEFQIGIHRAIRYVSLLKEEKILVDDDNEQGILTVNKT